jgi:integrase
MARTVRDNNLETRAARGRLKPRGKPYYRALDEGLHIGYRKPRTGVGKWVMRHYAGGQTYVVETIAGADDLSDANGADVLSFTQAQTKARALRDERSRSAAGITGPFTVDAAMQDYLAFLEANRKTAADVRYRYEAFIKGPLGNIEASALKAKKIRDWHVELASSAPRVRTKKEDGQNYRKIGKDEDTKRRRKVSANRNLAVLKAALNMAWREGNVASDAAWRRVTPFAKVDTARVNYLTVADAKRFVNACDPDFRKLAQGALETGARYGELCRFRVKDFNPDTGTLAVHISKSGKPRYIVLTDEGRAFFRQVCIGRGGGDLIFTKASGGAWLKSHQDRPMAEAVKRTKISPAISFHALRHTWASLAVMAGVPLVVVAKNMGHRDTQMVERHYGHLAPSYIADAIRAGAPRFGFKPDTTVVGLTKARQ